MNLKNNQHRFLYHSSLIHLGIVVVFVLFVNFGNVAQKKKRIKFKVIDQSKMKKDDLEINISTRTKPKKEIKPKITKKIRKVYGVSKKSLTSKSLKANVVKQGNTITKSLDKLKMTKDDVDELPIPKAEYLVTGMPSVTYKSKINYPPKAKEIGLEGTVILNVLIDEKGNVRDANVVEGLTPEIDSEALRAIKKYKFSPAKIEETAVAVKVRYAIKFVLEDS